MDIFLQKYLNYEYKLVGLCLGDQISISTASDGVKLLSVYDKNCLSYLYLDALFGIKCQAHVSLTISACLEGIRIIEDNQSIARHTFSDYKKLTKQQIQEYIVFL